MKLFDDGAIPYYLGMGNKFSESAVHFFEKEAADEDDEHCEGAFGVFAIGTIQTMIFSTYMTLKTHKSPEAARDWLTLVFQHISNSMSKNADINLAINVQMVDKKGDKDEK